MDQELDRSLSDLTIFLHVLTFVWIYISLAATASLDPFHHRNGEATNCSF